MARVAILITVTYVANLEGYKVTSTQFAVDPEVEQRQLSHSLFHLKPYPQRPDVLQLKGCFLSNDLALVPRFVTNRMY